jgi:hypothetical protein
VSWSTVSGAAAYNVFYNTANNSSTAAQSGGDYTGTSATITGLTNGTLYYVWLKAKNAGGSSGFSPVSSTTPVPPPPAAPAAPTLTPGFAQIAVSWTEVTGATAYNVFYNTTNNSSTAAQSGGDYTGTSATITGLTNGTLYYVWLKAKNAGGSSGFSSVSSCRLPPNPPAAPTLVSSDTKLNVSWATVSGATAYNVFYNTVNNSSTATQFGSDYTGTSATITGLVNYTTYYVWLKAKNSGGSSPFSPSASKIPRLQYAALSAGGATLAQFNGKYVYTIVAPQPAAKPEGSGTPTTSYAFTLSSVAGSLPSPEPAASPAGALDRLPAVPYGGAQTELDLLLRETESKLLARKAKQLSKELPGIEAAAPYPISKGTSWNGVYIYGTTPSTIDTTCRYISSHAYFFVDNRDIAAMEPLLAGYGASFDATYDVNRSKFGAENDVDANGKVIVVFSEELVALGYLGYFWAVDKFANDPSSNPYSNEGDIFYVTTDAAYQGEVVNGTLAHEFQHMIYFDQHYNFGVTSTYAWLNEALSQAAEYYNNYVDNHEGWIFSFLYSGWSSGLSLTHWTSSNYGYGAIYIRYLIDQFGDAAIKNMCSTDKVGVAAVEFATGGNFNTIFNNFTRALLMSGTGDSADPKYNFATLDLQAVQPYGRGGLRITASNAAGSTVSGSLRAYSLAASGWTGTFGSMALSGTDVAGSAFGLVK